MSGEVRGAASRADQPAEARYSVVMATEFLLDPQFAAVVERARRRAASSGDLPAAKGRFESRIPEEARVVIAQWLRDGGYDDAIAQIAAEDPDLANQ